MIKTMKYKLKIEVIGARASLMLFDKKELKDSSSWTDDRDLAEKILGKIEALIIKNRISLKDISKVVFDCDSPYFKKEKLGLEAMDSKGRCGFTSWQIGEITAKTLNYCISGR